MYKREILPNEDSSEEKENLFRFNSPEKSGKPKIPERRGRNSQSSRILVNEMRRYSPEFRNTDETENFSTLNSSGKCSQIFQIWKGERPSLSIGEIVIPNIIDP